MNITQYVSQLNTRYQSGISREHAYRADLENLIRELVPGIEITNEPANVTDCGNPDYIITRRKIPVGYIEAKDIGKDLNGKNYKEQFDRYKKALDNLIITDYLWFQFFQNGVLVYEVRIAETGENKIIPLPGNFQQFETLIRDFCAFTGQTIKSGKKLAEMMAAKARLLENILERAVTADGETQENSSLKSQYETFKQILIHDLSPKAFADIYAQTLAYGLFAARLHDPSLQDFSRQEAAELIPKTNPFLRKLFQYVAGYDIDGRIKTTVDNLSEVFRATDVKALLQNLGNTMQANDPVIHFYETFLAEYDPSLRKSKGVWYTPQPVVNFIVRAVDDILITDFNLPEGIADTGKTKIKVPVQGSNKMAEMAVHRIQILDPATGTGTFLAEVLKHIFKTRFQHMQGAWGSYVEEHLVPRLNGFELLMASYTMAHLKLDMLLTETGYKPKKEQRFNIYLTNSLEEHHPDTGTLFANWLSTEANQANRIKRDTPVMVVMGNPPYSVSSSNKSEWIEKLTADYKKNLNERNIQPLSDDYIKFIRFGQHFIEKNGEGILAYISNNSFIDGLIHRQMRKNLLETFDKIYILDLHGNAKKKETAPDGGKDENVFDIMQGVSINIFMKTGGKRKNPLAKVFHCDVFGKRQEKYDFLDNHSIADINWKELNPGEPNYFLVAKDFDGKTGYEKGFKIDEILKVNSSGIKTHRDHFVIDFNKDDLVKRIKGFYDSELNEIEVGNQFELKDNRDWSIKEARKATTFNPSKITLIEYRPFDKRFCYYESSLIDFGRENVMMHFLNGSNLGLSVLRQSRAGGSGNYWVNNSIIGKDAISSLDTCTTFPLYLYPETGGQQTILRTTPVFDHPSKGESTTPVFGHPSGGGEFRKPNLNMEIVGQIAERLGLGFVLEKEAEGNVCFINSPEVRNDFKTTFSPVDILDYIYAVLHSPAYREKYKEFLKIDFPRVPYPKDAETFWQLVEPGSELRRLHLLEGPALTKSIVSYPVEGDNTITKPFFHSPPSEGCPQDGVVETPTITVKNSIIQLNPVLELPYNPRLKQHARELRQAGNLPEVLFWMQVTKGGFYNIDFDRQRVIGDYIVDFYVKRLGLVVEIDGESHIGKEEYDREREDFLLSLGLRVYRIKVEDVMQRLPEVMKELEDYILEEYRPPRLSGTPPKEGNEPPLSSTTPPKEGNVGRVYINESQYFDGVPEIAWNFYIGGYQPAQKWLKDRKGRKLEYEDIVHYRKIIAALNETHRLMQEVDKTGFLT